MEAVTFFLAAIISLAGACGVVFLKNPVHAALSLVATLFGVAIHFINLEAYFVAAVQVIVYAGAIVILFLFVIMLLGVERAESIKTDPIIVNARLVSILPPSHELNLLVSNSSNLNMDVRFQKQWKSMVIFLP